MAANKYRVNCQSKLTDTVGDLLWVSHHMRVWRKITGSSQPKKSNKLRDRGKTNTEGIKNI